MGVTTPTAKRLVAAPGTHLWMNWPDDLIAIEQEAAAAERERLRETVSSLVTDDTFCIPFDDIRKWLADPEPSDD